MYNSQNENPADEDQLLELINHVDLNHKGVVKNSINHDALIEYNEEVKGGDMDKDEIIKEFKTLTEYDKQKHDQVQ